MTRLIVLFLFAFVNAAAAAPIRVQTGEHPQFTRVVLRISPGTEWTLGRAETGYMLWLPAADGYDLRGFFDRIPKTRIEEVAQSHTGGLVFVVSCNCRAEGFLVGEDLLVIDVSDGPPLPNSKFEERIDLDDPSAQLNGRTFTLGSLPILPDMALLQHMPRGNLVDFLPETPIVETSEPSGTQFDNDLGALEVSISQSLATGLTQGVLERDMGDVSGIDDELRAQLRNAHAGIPGITTRTNLDILAAPQNRQVSETQSGEQCLPPSYFAVTDWADERPFSEQLAAARRDVISERDRIDEVGVLRLARLFVFFGFGQEAIRTLDLDGVHSQERTYLAQIAHIVDGDGRQSADLFDKEVSCDSPAALWAMLADQDGPMDALVDRAAVLRAFKALPAHLQRYIGPQASNRFIAIGDHDAALQVLDVGRNEMVKTIDATLAEASLDHAMGAGLSATETIVATVRGNARATPEAMIIYLNQAIENGSEITPADFELANVLRFENAHSPNAGDLLEAQIRGHIAQREFDQAKWLILKGTDVLENVQVLWDMLAARAVIDMENAMFLSFAFDVLPDLFSSDERRKVAQRLASLGFPERANLFSSLRQPVPIAQDPAAFARGEIVSDRQELPEQPHPTEPDLVDWTQGNWERLATSTDPLFQEASRAMMADDVASSVQQPPLASGRELLLQSQGTRETLETILQRFPVPSDL